jgi:hypothetical protein
MKKLKIKEYLAIKVMVPRGPQQTRGEVLWPKSVMMRVRLTDSFLASFFSPLGMQTVATEG